MNNDLPDGQGRRVTDLKRCALNLPDEMKSAEPGASLGLPEILWWRLGDQALATSDLPVLANEISKLEPTALGCGHKSQQSSFLSLR